MATRRDKMLRHVDTKEVPMIDAEGCVKCKLRTLSLFLSVFIAYGCGARPRESSENTKETDAATGLSCPRWQEFGERGGFGVRYCDGGSDDRDFPSRLELRDSRLSIIVPLYHSSSCDPFADWETNAAPQTISVKLFPRPTTGSDLCLTVVIPYLLQFEFALPKPGEYSVTVTTQVHGPRRVEKAKVTL